MTIKISAFPNASLPMGAGDLVTGLQGGVNVNFSQTQILTGQSGASGNIPGSNIKLLAGNGFGTGYGGVTTVSSGNGYQGGPLYLYGGNALSASAYGGDIYLKAGQSTGSLNGTAVNAKAGDGGPTGPGGIMVFSAGSGGSISGQGGRVQFSGGNARGGGAGGAVRFTSGNGVSAPGGVISFVPGNGTPPGSVAFSLSSGGYLLLYGLPVSSAGLPTGAVWNNSGVLNIA